MNKEQEQIIDEEYALYLNESRIYNYPESFIVSKEEFINKCKTNPEFSETWGLKIEERELSLDERAKLHPDTEMFYNIHGTFSIQNSIEDSNFPHKDWLHEQFSRGNIPTKLITITYNDTKLESYE
jgi:hypothetical protein